uniref:RRM domain-containing protein n=1 Tax=Kalanchoe fedtschenkoi TaxID=63787 RepID=A0A7N0ZTP9_KALFE
MSSALDMSLDDLIKNNKKSRSGPGAGAGRGRGRGGRGGVTGLGPARRIQKRGVNRPAPYPATKAVGWQHMFVDQTVAAQAGMASSLETGTKLYISNLDYGVSNDDIQELFSEVGDLKKYSIHYDRSGRSKGTAEVVYSRRADAVAAVKRYNNVQLDGKPMKIEIVGVNVAAPAPVVSNVLRGTANGGLRGGIGRGGPFGRIRGGGIGGRGRGRGASGRGRGRGRGRSEKLSAEDLDADLDKYHQESMQIN